VGSGKIISIIFVSSCEKFAEFC